MTIIKRFQNHLKALDAAEVDRILWQLKMFCIEHVEGYGDYRALQIEQTTAGTERQRKKDLEEAAKLANEKFRRRRLEIIAEERAAEQLEHWQTARTEDTVSRNTIAALFGRSV